MNLDCDNCKTDKANKLYATKDGMRCNLCREHKPTYNYMLFSKEQYGVSLGKRFEIDNRVVSKDDGKTIINRKTGKPAQY